MPPLAVPPRPSARPPRTPGPSRPDATSAWSSCSSGDEEGGRPSAIDDRGRRDDPRSQVTLVNRAGRRLQGAGIGVRIIADALLEAGRAVTGTIYLAHGASGTAASMRPHLRGLEARGLRAVAVQLHRGGPAERAVPRYREQLRGTPSAAVIGGHSFGGRVASLLAAEEQVAGLVLLSFPLHGPGRPETAAARTAHFAAIRCPVLLLSGESDPFARLEPLREAVKRLPNAELVTYPGIGHGLQPVLDDALDRIAAFVHVL